MTVMAFNGSPRKKGNTATLLEYALQGAASRGTRTALVHLYDLDFKGCRSCYSCKKPQGGSYGRCAVRDALTPLLEQAREARAMIFGSPVYCGGQTGVMRCFLERLMYPSFPFAEGVKTLCPRTIPTAFIHTMGVSAEQASAFGFHAGFNIVQGSLERLFGPSQILLSSNTLQAKEHEPFGPVYFDVEDKKRHHAEAFPGDCRRAFALGSGLAGGAA